MNIDELKFGEIKQIAALLNGAASPADGLNRMIGQKVIIRTCSAGNFFGTLEAKSGDEIYLTNARRMWYWKAAQGISLSACALGGIDQAKSQIVAPVERIWLQAIEIIPCTQTAIESIEGAPHAQAR